MKYLRWLILSLLPLLVGCASTETIPTAQYVEPSAPESAVVYVYRTQSMPTKANVRVEIDGKLVALLPDNRFTWLPLGPGRHAIRVGYPSFPDMSKTLEIDALPGQKYLVQYRGDAGAPLMQLFGAGGTPLGTYRTGRMASTNLDLQPNKTIEQVTETLLYVPPKL
jgi:hypothetical protein